MIQFEHKKMPFYNIIILLKIVGKPWWWLLLLFVPFVNYVIIVWMINLLSLSFGKTTGYTLGLIFLGFIFYPMLAFGDATYNGPAAADAATNYPEDYGQE